VKLKSFTVVKFSVCIECCSLSLRDGKCSKRIFLAADGLILGEAAADLGGPVTETTVGLVEPVTETTVGLAVNKDKMLEAYETGDIAGKLSMLIKGTLTGCRI
jgi:hypothetical protein